MHKIKSIAGFVMGLGVSAIALYSHATYEPLTPNDFVEVEGTFRFAQERVAGKHSSLKVYLNENSSGFIISKNHYNSRRFDDQDFFANVQTNDPIVLEVQRVPAEAGLTTAEVNNTQQTSSNLYIYGMRDETQDYLMLNDTIAWSDKNNQMALVVGIGMLLFSGTIFITEFTPLAENSKKLEENKNRSDLLELDERI